MTKEELLNKLGLCFKAINASNLAPTDSETHATMRQKASSLESEVRQAIADNYTGPAVKGGEMGATFKALRNLEAAIQLEAESEAIIYQDLEAKLESVHEEIELLKRRIS